MTLAAAVLTVLLMVLVGLAMFRRLARALLAGRQGEVGETDLLMLGVLPGLALVGMLGTWLAAIHMLRFGSVVFLAIVILYVCRREAYAILVNLTHEIAEWFAKARRGNLFPLIAVAVFCAALAASVLLCVIPSDNADVWVFHIPLVLSFIAHHGLVFPQLPGMLLYSTQPDFQEILFSIAMMAVPTYVAAGMVNVAVLFGFLALLPSFAKRARDIQFLLVCLLFFWWNNFPQGASEPMGDMSRSCFSIGAFLFAYRYATSFRCFELAMSALLAGAAVASKYTELITPGLIFIAIVPLMINRRHTWLHAIPAVLIFLAVSGVWYLRNTIVLGNPVYPFLFAHPGYSNQHMADYMLEMTRPFNPADRIYSTNLLTLQGWRDFLAVLQKYFSPLLCPAIVAAVSLFLPQPRRWMLPFWSVALFILWYALMFNALRWSTPAILMLTTSAFVTWVWVADRFATFWNPHWPTMALEAAVRAMRRDSNPWVALASTLTLLFLICGLLQFKEGDENSLLPNWMSRDLAVALVNPAHMDRYMAESRPGYRLYRYIAQHDLRKVLQPFDNGASFDASSYNGGHNNDWVLNFTLLPASVAQTDNFVAQYDVHYFVDREPVKQIDVERLGAGHVAIAKAVIARLKSHARLVLQDRDMYLYEILPAGAKP